MPGRSGSHYNSEAVGWTEFNQPPDTNWYEVPEGSTIRDNVDAGDVEAIWVHVYNVDDPSDDHWFWVRSYMSLDWDQWDYIVGQTADMHNMSLS